MREPRRGGTRCGRWMGIAAALLIAGLLQGGSLRGADPYRIDGWERYFAPLLDQWLILGPLPSQESVDALTSPEGLKDLFPEEGALTGGLTWRKADSAGEGVPLGAGVGGKGGRTVALTFLNHETGGEVLLHFSKRGIGRTRVLIEGVPIVSLGEEEERKEAVPFHVRRGWSRLQLALEVKAAGARFYCLITDEVGEAVGLYNQAQLFKRQRESFDTGFPLRGRVWQRVQGRAVGALNGPFSADGRELAILRM
ncbi:MAG: hypothetical protein ACE5GW_09830, partial [Planctomycetota bacterium]